MIEDRDTSLSQFESCEASRKRFEEYNTKRDEISLTKKYFAICEVASCISSRTKNTLINPCQDLVAQRLISERNSVQ